MTRGLAWLSLLFRALAPGRLLQRMVLWFVKTEAACCTSDSPHFRFMQRYVDRFERAGTFERMRHFLSHAPRGRAATRLDAWMRIGLVGTWRHQLYRPHLGTHGLPPRLLTEAQLALSPGCDLTCEGCYTVEDRGGQAPRRERIAWLVDQVTACGAFAVHVIGKGEPFLSPTWAAELLDVIEARPETFFTVATHGMHITEAQAARMGRLGNLVLLVAVDGPEPLHDARRGAGSYRKVHEKLAMLRRHGVVYGYSCMVSAKSHRAVTSREFIRAQEEAGCVVGVMSRYFPLTASAVSELTLSASDMTEYLGNLERAHQDARLVLLDLDEVEQHTGCHSRAGESVYIDGISGQVSPCLRVPFAPAECRVGETRSLADVLGHSYFVEYRRGNSSCPSWCGANLDGELGKVGRLLDEHQARPARLDVYQERARPVRRLPIIPSETP